MPFAMILSDPNLVFKGTMSITQRHITRNNVSYNGILIESRMDDLG